MPSVIVKTSSFLKSIERDIGNLQRTINQYDNLIKTVEAKERRLDRLMALSHIRFSDKDADMVKAYMRLPYRTKANIRERVLLSLERHLKWPDPPEA